MSLTEDFMSHRQQEVAGEVAGAMRDLIKRMCPTGYHAAVMLIHGRRARRHLDIIETNTDIRNIAVGLHERMKSQGIPIPDVVPVTPAEVQQAEADVLMSAIRRAMPLIDNAGGGLAAKMKLGAAIKHVVAMRKAGAARCSACSGRFALSVDEQDGKAIMRCETCGAEEIAV